LQADTAGTATGLPLRPFAERHAEACVRLEENIYDLVERAAAQRGIRRLELWLKALRAIEKGELEVWIDQRLQQPPGWQPWIATARAAVERHNDPNGFAHILKLITATVANFNQWLRTAYRIPRGPTRGGTGFSDADRKLFPEISNLIDTGEVRSAYGAALILADKMAGKATRESKAKRVSALYRKEQGARS
jgi:hypothetical protein